MIDAVLKFASAAAAKTALAKHAPVDDQGVAQWAQDHCLQINVWRNSQDAADGTHTPLAGFFVLISLSPQDVAEATNLKNSPAIQFAVDGDTNAVLKSAVGQAVLQDIRFEPVFAGRNYPWGAWA